MTASADQFSVLLAEILRSADAALQSSILDRALQAAAERERHRLGQELHDHLCQHLVGAAFAAKAAAYSLPADSPLAAEINDLARLINSAVQQVRDLARGSLLASAK